MPNQPLMTPEEVRSLLNISDDALRKLIRDGKLRATVLGPRLTRIYRNSVEELITKGDTHATS